MNGYALRTEWDIIRDLRDALNELDAARRAPGYYDDPARWEIRQRNKNAAAAIQRALLTLLARAMEPSDDDAPAVVRSV